jgi:NitT/TauT family transport system substrate-binding protein
MHDFQIEQGSLNESVDLDALFDTSLFDAVIAERDSK